MLSRGRALWPAIGAFFLLITCEGGPDARAETPNMGLRPSKAEDACAVIVVRNKRGQEFKTGSGFFINSNGWFVTNYHVIEGGYTAWLRTRDGAQHAVLGTINVWPRGDLAILATARSNTSWLALADPRDTKVGLNLTLLGAPGGAGWTQAGATVEAIVEEGGVRTVQYKVALEGAAPGSSGSPLFDIDGRVHAVHSKWEARVLMNENGEWRLSWEKPQIRGIHCAELARLLSAPPRPMPMARLGMMANDAMAANVLLAICVLTDPMLREIRNLMNGTVTITRSTDVRRDVIGLSGQRYTTVSQSFVVTPPEIDHWVRQFGRLHFFLHGILAELSLTDPSLQKAIQQWGHSFEYLRQGVERLGPARGGTPTEVSRVLEGVRSDFRNANDSFYFALEGAWGAWRKYSGWSQQPPLFNEGLVRAALEFYGERKLELTNWP